MRQGRGRHVCPLLAAAVLLAAPRLAHAAGDWFVLASWYQKQGLPENTIRHILESRDGYLWIATHAGVARFDGVRFTTYDDRRDGQFRDIEVQAMEEGADGSLWMGTYGGGLSRLQDGRFTIYTKRDGLIDDFVLSVCRDREGAMWVATTGGVSRWKDGHFTSFTTADGLLKNATHGVFADGDGSVWVATRDGGLQRFFQGRFHPEPIEGMGPEVIVRHVLRARDGALWVSTYGGLYRVEGGRTRHYTDKDGLRSSRLASLMEDAEGTLWIAHDKGLDWFRDGQFHGIGELAGTGVTALAASGEGGVWVGGGRLSLLRRGQFLRYFPSEGLPHQYVTTVFEDRQNSVWIGTIKGLARLAGERLEPARGLPPGYIGAMAEDHAGALWVSTDELGLYRSQGPDRQFARAPAQPAHLQARAMYVDRRGDLWVGTVGEGLYRYRDGTFTAYGAAQGLLHGAVRGIQEDRRGDLWIGTRNGLNRLRDGKLTGYGVAEGLAHPAVESLYLDRDDTLWIGTRQGVSRLRDGRFTSYTAGSGLLANYVNSFAEDDGGNLWMTCIRGVFQVSKPQLDAFAAGTLAKVVPVSYGLEHGLVSTRSTAGFDRSAYKTRDGRIWLASVHGLSVIDPASILTNRRPPPVHVEEVRLDDRTVTFPPARASLEVGPGRGDLAIEYTALSFLAPEKVRFQYQLAGYDPGWVEAGTRRAAYYSHLPPGRYRFRVIAANNDGVWNSAGAAVDLFLRPHWYQTRLFQLSAVLAVLLLAAGLYGNHVAQLKRRQRELERRVDERTAELAAANTELEAFSYSVSHDLRAPVRSIQGFSRALLVHHAGSLDAEGRQYLQHLQGASRRMDMLIVDMMTLARAGRAEIHRSPVDLGALAREIFQELQARDGDRAAELVVPADLTVQVDPNLMRILLGNLLGNAWKFTSKRARARIEVGVTAGASPAYFVRDDGVGFDPAHAGKMFEAFRRLHSASEFEGSGVGLAIVRRVVERHGGEVWAEGTPGEGAAFYFTLPAQAAAASYRLR